jgi:hypothetical protein
VLRLVGDHLNYTGRVWFFCFPRWMWWYMNLTIMLTHIQCTINVPTVHNSFSIVFLNMTVVTRYAVG